MLRLLSQEKMKFNKIRVIEMISVIIEVIIEVITEVITDKVGLAADSNLKADKVANNRAAGNPGADKVKMPEKLFILI